MRRLILVAALAAMFVLHAWAQTTRTRIDVSKLGPQVGERVPDFQLRDQTGTPQTLQSIIGRRGAMLVFVRSADW
jgi:cytochrome oxidase Cu insertion factor (SCO1/SenC/PrrC family)